MNLIGRPALVLATLLGLLPTLFVVIFFLPTFLPADFGTAPGLLYGLGGGWLLCRVSCRIFLHRFTPLERGILEFWRHTFFFILVFFVVLGAFPLFVLPALGKSLGWSFLSSAAYLHSAKLIILLFSGLVVWSLWQKHWASLVASSGPQERAAQRG